MYASQGKIPSAHNTSDKQPAIPVETYDNRAILEELARRNNAEQVQHAPNHNYTECADDTADENNCEHAKHHLCSTAQTNSHIKHKRGLFDSFGADDALILLIILLTLSDNDGNNDILLPILLGLLLLT